VEVYLQAAIGSKWSLSAPTNSRDPQARLVTITLPSVNLASKSPYTNAVGHRNYDTTSGLLQYE